MKVWRLSRTVVVLGSLTVGTLSDLVKAQDKPNLDGDALKEKGVHGLSDANEPHSSQQGGADDSHTSWRPKVLQSQAYQAIVFQR
jgi:hypothetical protein